MSTEPVTDDERKKNRYHFDRHTPEYREQFTEVTAEMLDKCPVAWSDTYGGHWVAAGHHEVFELARSAEYLSNDHDRATSGAATRASRSRPRRSSSRAASWRWTRPSSGTTGRLLNPYLSPAAVARWTPVVDEMVRACLNEKIETGQIDFVDDLANVVPAVLTLAMLGVPLKNWDIYCEPIHASVYTPPDSPDIARVRRTRCRMCEDMMGQLAEIRASPRPGHDRRAGAGGDQRQRRRPTWSCSGMIALLIGGGFDTTTALTAHSLEWLSEHPDRAGAAVGRAGHAARPGDRGVPALLHPGPGRRAHDLGRLRDRGPAVQGGRAALAVVGDVQPRPVGLPQPQRGRPGPHRQPAPQLRPRHPPLHRVQRGPDGVQADGHRRCSTGCRTYVCDPAGRGALRDDRRHPGHEAPARHLHPRAADRRRAGRDDRPDAGHRSTSSGWPSRSPCARARPTSGNGARLQAANTPDAVWCVGGVCYRVRSANY